MKFLDIIDKNLFFKFYPLKVLQLLQLCHNLCLTCAKKVHDTSSTFNWSSVRFAGYYVSLEITFPQELILYVF